MREIGCCQLGVYIPLWEFAEFPWREDHLNKQTNKQTNKQINKQQTNRPILQTAFSNKIQTESKFYSVVQRRQIWLATSRLNTDLYFAYILDLDIIIAVVFISEWRICDSQFLSSYSKYLLHNETSLLQSGSGMCSITQQRWCHAP